MNTSSIISRVWSFCTTLRDDGVGYGDYLEQLTYSGVRAETLRQSILKKAFSGKLVPQDPNDEPASELLARIKAEKAQQKQSANKVAIKRKRKKVSEEA